MSNLFTSAIYFCHKIFTLLQRQVFLDAGYFCFMLNSTDYYRAAICGIISKIFESFYFRITHHLHIQCWNFMQLTYGINLFFQLFWSHLHPSKYLSRKSFITVVYSFSVLLCSSSYKILVTSHVILSLSLSLVRLGEVRLIFVRFNMETRIICLR